MGGSTTPRPTDRATGYQCAVGTFCPAGSTNSTPCTAGSYCPSTGASAPAGPCQSGYFCLQGSTSSAPVSSAEGGKCPAGHYCPAGASVPSACNVGTFASTIGNQNATACLPCLAGFYCNTSGLAMVTSMCTATYYCPTGTTVPTLLCPTGNTCPQGSVQPLPCSPGTFQVIERVPSVQLA